MKRKPRRWPGLRSTQPTQSTASALARRAIIQRFLLSANAFTRACKWPGCLRAKGRGMPTPARGDVCSGSNSEVELADADFRFAPESGHPVGGLGCPKSAKLRHSLDYLIGSR